MSNNISNVSDEESKKFGDCYQAAWRYQNEKDLSATLVHGKISALNQDCIVNHAWVEKGGLVYEVANGADLVYEKEDYYRIMGVTFVKTYDHIEAFREAVHHYHTGPWIE